MKRAVTWIEAVWSCAGQRTPGWAFSPRVPSRIFEVVADHLRIKQGLGQGNIEGVIDAALGAFEMLTKGSHQRGIDYAGVGWLDERAYRLGVGQHTRILARSKKNISYRSRQDEEGGHSLLLTTFEERMLTLNRDLWMIALQSVGSDEVNERYLLEASGLVEPGPSAAIEALLTEIDQDLRRLDKITD